MPSASRFIIAGVVIVTIVLFATVTKIEPFDSGLDHALEGSGPIVESNNAMDRFVMYLNVAIMIFIGFGYLMTFVHRYTYSALGFTFICSVLAILLGILLDGFWYNVEHGEWHAIPVDIKALILGLFSAAAVMISFGALLGRTTLGHMLFVTIVEVFMYSLNIYICEKIIKLKDIGGTIIIHTFGAYFGLATSWAAARRRKGVEPKELAPSHTSDTFAMSGTIWLWICWPTFVGGMAETTDEAVSSFINTIFCLMGSCMGAFLASMIFRHGNKLDMVDIQNATLAGGVSIGASANLFSSVALALGLGVGVGIWSVVGYTWITPFLQKKINLADTCGIHNLHGMPGFIGGCISVLALLGRDQFRPIWWRNLISIPITLSMAIASGLTVGYLLSCYNDVDPGLHGEDSVTWNVPSEVAEAAGAQGAAAELKTSVEVV